MRKALERRQEEGRLRELPRPERRLVDFCSNDYLGLARQRGEPHGSAAFEAGRGATGSRLISGNSAECEELEARIAGYHGAEAALIFPSGYAANLGLLGAVPQRGDTLLYDELAHASLRDGARLNFAREHPFRHNDLSSLNEKIGRTRGKVFVAVESLYSMDGDFAPLPELCSLCEHAGAELIVDEAHAAGVYGANGEGLAVQMNCADRVFARVITFGKAFGAHGAAVLGSRTLRSFLINFCRPFIYTTALPPAAVTAIAEGYDLMAHARGLREQLQSRIHLFRQECRGLHSLCAGGSPIQAVLCPGNREVREAARRLQAAGWDVRPIMSPTVPGGRERLRVCLHSFNTDEEIRGLARSLKEILP